MTDPTLWAIVGGVIIVLSLILGLAMVWPPLALSAMVGGIMVGVAVIVAAREGGPEA